MISCSRDSRNQKKASGGPPPLLAARELHAAMGSGAPFAQVSGLGF